MAYPHTLEDTLRAHDQAIVNWLDGLRVDYNTAGGVLLGRSVGDASIVIVRSGSNQTITGTLPNTGIIPGSVVVTAEVPGTLDCTAGDLLAAAFSDDGAGAFITSATGFTVTASSIDYGTGAFTITIDTVEFQADVALVTYRYAAGGMDETTDLSDEPILWRFASPHRMVAALADALVTRDWIPGTTAADMRENAKEFLVLPLPFVTIRRGDPVRDTSYEGVPKEFRLVEYDPDTNKFIKYPYPSHFRTTYTLNFWCHYRYSEAHVREWMYAQFGRRGALHNEAFIPVVHASPFGTWTHSLLDEGTSDLSDLESEDDQRWIRFEWTLSLRTWMFLPSSGEEVAVDALVFNDEVSNQTSNIYTGVTEPLGWYMPSLGAPEFEIPASGALDITLNEEADKLRLLEYMTTRDDTGDDGAMYVSFKYTSDGDATLRITQGPDTTPQTVIERIALPESAGETLVHRFFFVDDAMFNVYIDGTDPVAEREINLTNIDVRGIKLDDLVVQDAEIIIGSDRVHTWTGLENEPYIVLAKISSLGGSPVTFTVADYGDPSVFRAATVESGLQAGFVILMQPVTGSLKLTYPSSTTLANLYAHRYYGAWNGDTI